MVIFTCSQPGTIPGAQTLRILRARCFIPRWVFCVVLNILYHIDFPIVLIQKLFGCIGLFPRKRYKTLSIYLYLYHLQTEFIISVVMIIIFIILIFNIVIEWKTKPWCGSCGQCELFLFNSWGLVFMNTPMGKHKLSGESPDDYRKLQSEERHRPRKAQICWVRHA